MKILSYDGEFYPDIITEYVDAGPIINFQAGTYLYIKDLTSKDNWRFEDRTDYWTHNPQLMYFRSVIGVVELTEIKVTLKSMSNDFVCKDILTNQEM